MLLNWLVNLGDLDSGGVGNWSWDSDGSWGSNGIGSWGSNGDWSGSIGKWSMGVDSWGSIGQWASGSWEDSGSSKDSSWTGSRNSDEGKEDGLKLIQKFMFKPIPQNGQSRTFDDDITRNLRS